jgi:hypothetical protein
MFCTCSPLTGQTASSATERRSRAGSSMRRSNDDRSSHGSAIALRTPCADALALEGTRICRLYYI